jgi:carbon storage regulator
MLVLTRRVGEVIVIAGEIRVRVVAIHGSNVRLGLTAPASVHVARSELAERDSPKPDGKKHPSGPDEVGRNGACAIAEVKPEASPKG